MIAKESNSTLVIPYTFGAASAGIKGGCSANYISSSRAKNYGSKGIVKNFCAAPFGACIILITSV